MLGEYYMTVKLFNYNDSFCAENTNQSSTYYDNQYYLDIVPLYGPHFPIWQSLSAEVRQSASDCKLDQTYGIAADETFDYFPATNGSKDAPLVIFFHGGNWCRLDKNDHSFAAKVLPSLGISVAIPNYSLCPKVTLDIIVQQSIDVTRYLYESAEEYTHAKDKIFVCGHSAGGHLASLMTAVNWQHINNKLPDNLVKGGLAISGLYDLMPISLTPVLQKDLHFDRAIIKNYSPIYIEPKTNVPLVVAVGGDETSEFQHQTQLLSDAWDIDSKNTLTISGTHHCSVVESLADKDSELLLKLLDLVFS